MKYGSSTDYRAVRRIIRFDGLSPCYSTDYGDSLDFFVAGDIAGYLTYDTTQDFLPQFEENLNALGLLYKKLDGLLLSMVESADQASE